MQARDLDTVARLEGELFTSASWSRAALEQELTGPGRTYLVWTGGLPNAPQNEANATPCDAVLGYAGLWCAEPGADAEIMTIGVDKRAQRSGIGRALLQALVGAAHQQRARRLLLEVRVDNEPAKNMYRKFGFQPMGLRKHYYQPEDVDAVTMSLNLEESMEANHE
jgi:ribosomal-protein-alanine N-acetyltransferase